VVPDVPTEFPTPTGVFRPVNYDRRYLGPVRLREALGNSLNVPAVRVLATGGGAPALRALLEECGLTTLDRPADFYGLGLTLGNAEVRLLEVVNAYAALARLGEYRPFRLLPSREGPAPAARRIASPAAAWLVADVLSDNEARRRAFGPESALLFDFPVACKTGTSADYRDNWAVGYTPEFTVGVWVGNLDGAPMRRLAGVAGAAPVLKALIRHLHAQRGTSAFARPHGVGEDWVDPLTGRRCSPDRQGAVRENFLAAAPPPAAADADYDERGRVRLGAEYAEWFASGDNGLRDRVVLAEAPEAAPLRLLSPLPGARYYLDPDLPDRGQWLPLRATGPTKLEWSSPTLEIVGSNRALRARLVEGRHQIAVRVPETGQRAEAGIEVRRR
jgi:penicillin-binding protein 1C